MPFKRITRGSLIYFVGQGDGPPVHLVEAPVQIFFEPPPN